MRIGGAPVGPMSLIFMQFSAESLSSNRLAHPLLRIRFWEILDPPLFTIFISLLNARIMLFFVIVDQLDKISLCKHVFLITWTDLLNLSSWSTDIDKNRHGFK